MQQVPFMSIEGLTSSETSIALRPVKKTYSIFIVISDTSDTPDIDIKLQISGDGTNWLDLSDAVQLGVAADGNINFDINTGFHEFVRVVSTRNTGTYTINAYLNNGTELWRDYRL